MAGIACLAVSCLSTSGGTYRQAELAGARSRVTWVTPLNDDFKTLDQFNRVVSSPKEALKLYCTGGRPARAWNMPVRAIVPRLPAGIPIDEASQVKGQVYERFKAIIGPKLFFDETAPVADGKNEAPLSEIVFALPAADRKSVEKAFRETRLSRNVTTLLLGFDGENGMLLGAMDSQYYGVEHFGAPHEDKWQLKARPAAMFPNGGIMGTVLQARRLKTSNGENIWPVHPSAVLEAALLPKHFTMLIPPAVQARYFADSMPENGFFVRANGTFDLGQAVNERQKLWNAYFLKSVAVEEAQTADPDVVQFNVRLDLSLFCAYARPADELLTR